LEILKTALERLFLFIASLIPGAAGLFLFTLGYPDLAASFWHAGYLEYKTKVAIVIVSAFVLGWTIAITLGTVGLIVGSIIGSFSNTPEPSLKPWRNPNWRGLLTSYLGKAAPENIPLVPEELTEARLKIAQTLTEPERTQQIIEAYSEKARAEFSDLQWAGWWHELHPRTLFGQLDPLAVMSNQLSASFHSASIVILCGTFFFPTLRHWWVFVLCLSWLVHLLLQAVGLILRIRDPWSSFSPQMKYLQDRLEREAPFALQSREKSQGW
jgi:hypothetical protein